MLRDDAQLAAAVGAKMLEWKGSEILEFIYFLQEKDTLKILREISRLSEDDKGELIEFMQGLHNKGRSNIKSYDPEISIEVTRGVRMKKAV